MTVGYPIATKPANGGGFICKIVSQQGAWYGAIDTDYKKGLMVFLTRQPKLGEVVKITGIGAKENCAFGEVVSAPTAFVVVDRKKATISVVPMINPASGSIIKPPTNTFVGAFFIHDKRGILLIQEHGKKKLPGGMMEQGETEQEAAARELLEETGLVASKVGEEVYSQFYPSNDPRRPDHWFRIRRVISVSGTLKAGANVTDPLEDIEKGSYFSAKQIEQFLAEGKIFDKHAIFLKKYLEEEAN